MVKLTENNEEPAGAVSEPVRIRPPRNHHNWGARLGRHREADRKEPTGLLKLEALAKRAVKLMEKHCPKSESNYDKAMDLLRLQYNLNFIVVCEKCNGTHNVDPMIAPER